MKMIVTGCNGFIGSRIACRLKRLGHNVLGVDPHTRCTDNYFEIRHLMTARDVDIWHPDVIILCGAIKGLAACRNSAAMKQNVFDLEKYLEFASVHTNVKVIFISSDMFLGGFQKGAPFDEHHPVCAGNEYGAMKIAGEQLVGLVDNSAIIRTAMVFDVLTEQERRAMLQEFTCKTLTNQSLFFYWAIRQLKTSGKVRLPINIKSTPTWAIDLVDDVERIIRGNLHGVFHSCGPKSYSRSNLAKSVLGDYDDCVEEYVSHSCLRPHDVSLAGTWTRTILGGKCHSPSDVMMEEIKKEFTR